MGPDVNESIVLSLIILWDHKLSIGTNLSDVNEQQQQRTH